MSLSLIYYHFLFLSVNKRCHILFHHHFVFFLKSKTNVVTNLNPLNSANNFLSLFLIIDSVSLICSSWLKKKNYNFIITFITFKSICYFCYFYIFFLRKIFTFFITLYKGLLELCHNYLRNLFTMSYSLG